MDPLGERGSLEQLRGVLRVVGLVHLEPYDLAAEGIHDPIQTQSAYRPPEVRILLPSTT